MLYDTGPHRPKSVKHHAANVLTYWMFYQVALVLGAL